MINLLYPGLFAPLAGFLILMLSSGIIRRQAAGLIACGALLISFICFSILLFLIASPGFEQQTVTLFSWVHFDKINADFTLHLDPLSQVMVLIITGVGFLIHVYSIGYMSHEEDFARYFAFLNFFVFAMLLLVLGGDLIVLFFGWEGVGLASYLLIGYYYHRPAAASAATKAFVVNRIGDLGFLLGIILAFILFGTGNIEKISAAATHDYSVNSPLMLALTLLLFLGAIGKSAQLPLHIWLPDAMEGPTPVSALIHAATMVTAGVYLIVRLHVVYMLAPTTLHLVGIIGSVTSLFAALCAVGQTDLKRVLAYSTVSQLGLMFVACGIGSFFAAMFHLTTHAFMKALLFLSAGNVVHMMQGNTDMDKMGGLNKKFPVTHWLFLIGVLAMSGFPPLAAFFSKDLILEQEYLAGFEVQFTIVVAASILTAFYLTRAYCLTFLGEFRLPEKIMKMVREAPKVMTVPVAVLALLSIFGGSLGFSLGRKPLLERFLERVGVTLSEKDLDLFFFLEPEALISFFGMLFGIGTAVIMYTKYADRFREPLKFLRRSFYIDEIYEAIVVRPLEAFARLLAMVIEPKFFDKSIHYTSFATQGVAALLQRFQSGQIRSYVAWMVVGTVLLLIYFVI